MDDKKLKSIPISVALEKLYYIIILFIHKSHLPRK